MITGICSNNDLVLLKLRVVNYSQALMYGKPDYQASAMVISESCRVVAITDETWSDSGTLEDLGHCGNESGKPVMGRCQGP
jgi:hypothetical protein